MGTSTGIIPTQPDTTKWVLYEREEVSRISYWHSEEPASRTMVEQVWNTTSWAMNGRVACRPLSPCTRLVHYTDRDCFSFASWLWNFISVHILERQKKVTLFTLCTQARNNFNVFAFPLLWHFLCSVVSCCYQFHPNRQLWNSLTSCQIKCAL